MAAEGNNTGKPSVPAPSQRDFVITRVFDAPRELVFKAWTDPKQMAQWWGPRGFTIPVCELDARPGGAHRIVMRSAGGADYPCKGVYLEVVEPRRIVMTQDCSEHPAQWHDRVKPNRAPGETNPAGELHTTVTFEDLGGRTRVTVLTRFASAEIGDAMKKMGMTQGWGQSLDRLTEHLAEESSADREIVICRVVDAPRELAWEAMTDPRHVVNWWGPRGFTNTIQVMDVRPGGAWKHVMHGPDGVDYPNDSFFKFVEKPRRIVYSHGGGRQGGPDAHFEATWTFDALEDNKTRVTIRMVFASAADRDRVVKEFGAVEGGKQTLARLSEYLPTMANV